MKYCAHTTVYKLLSLLNSRTKCTLTYKTCIAFVVCSTHIVIWAQIKDDDEILHVDQAFKLHAYLDAGNTIRAVWNIAEGYYLYRHGFKIETTEGINPDDFEIPSGTKTTDPYFGDVEVYYQRTSISVRVSDISENSRVGIRFQGCAKDRYCFAPQIRWFEFRDGAMVPSEEDKTKEGIVESLPDDLL